MKIPDPPGIVRPALRLGGWIALFILILIRWLALKLPNPPMQVRIPYVGDINGRMWASPVTIDDWEFGQSMGLPPILEIKIDGAGRDCRPKVLNDPVGVQLFAGEKPFLVNIAFSCGRASPLYPGLYADPRSPWFNVFTGYYQIDVPVSTWGRPFGYQAEGADFALRPDEIARLGRADGTTSPTSSTACHWRCCRPSPARSNSRFETARSSTARVGTA